MSILSPTSKVQSSKSVSVSGLRVTDLRKSFRKANGERIEVLRGVTLSVSAGEAVAIMGSSGAGKSTLLHVLAGLEAADHGRILAGEFAVEGANRSQLADFRNRHVGFVFQFHHLIADLTAAQNVGLPLLIARNQYPAAMNRAVEALNKVGLGGHAANLVGSLSGGEQQRVAVCRALINQPSLVLADEPTGNLDAKIGDEIARSLIKYAQSNPASLIIATHSESLARLCDRVLILQEGRLLTT